MGINVVLKTLGKNSTDEMGLVCLSKQGVACVSHLRLVSLPR